MFVWEIKDRMISAEILRVFERERERERESQDRILWGLVVSVISVMIVRLHHL